MYGGRIIGFFLEFSASLCKGGCFFVFYILYSDFEKLFSFTLNGDAAYNLTAVTERYLKHHLQRGYRSLEFFYSVAQQ